MPYTALAIRSSFSPIVTEHCLPSLTESPGFKGRLSNYPCPSHLRWAQPAWLSASWLCPPPITRNFLRKLINTRCWGVRVYLRGVCFRSTPTVHLEFSYRRSVRLKRCEKLMLLDANQGIAHWSELWGWNGVTGHTMRETAVYPQSIPEEGFCDVGRYFENVIFFYENERKITDFNGKII